MPAKQSISQARYDKENAWRPGLKLNMKTDADIAAHSSAAIEEDD